MAFDEIELPAPGALTIATFGPGIGEAVVVAFPDRSFGVIDGCRVEGQHNPARELAERMKQDGWRFWFVALSHPHDDHIDGMDETLALGPEELWLAGAEHPKLFTPIWERLRREKTQALQPTASAATTMCRNLDAIATLVAERPHDLRLRMLTEDQVLCVKDVDGASLRVACLLPTARSRVCAIHELGDPCLPDLPDVETHRKINDVSAVLHLTWGDASALLCGDAENGAWDRGLGAMADLQGLTLVKVAHHGSSGAHDPARWQRWAPRVAVVTPYRHGTGTMPPQRVGLEALRRDGTELWLTHPVAWSRGAAARPDAAVVVSLCADGGFGVRSYGEAWRYKG